MRLVLDDHSQRQAARHLGVSPQQVANELQECTNSLPEMLPRSQKPVAVARQDGLFTFIGKKRSLYHDHC
ncbi:MAG: hypothetical protein KJ069_23095 [Anaerolineae bacterium]|nr:hypothetical protein [Anaerolineae bacterium]